ncbi:MAG: cellulose binding domain-containing protein, partial [Gemmataceae bacterium]
MKPHQPSQVRLQIESLEQRLTPSGFQVDYRVTNNWGSGLQGQMQIRNEEVAGLSGWTLEFDYAGTISSIWDAQLVSRVGNHYQIKNATWNKDLPAGGSVSFGFIANPGGTVGNPTNYLLNGKPLDGAGPSLPTLKVDDISLAEGNSGQTSAVFTFLLSAPSKSPVSVNYATTPGTAESGIDFVASSGSLTFSPGETRKTVSVPVKGDLSVEADETFHLQLSQANGASLARSSSTATIRNDDMGPSTGDVTFKVDSDWGSGFSGSITIKNSKTVEMKDWKLEFDFAGTISSIWNARIVNQSGSHFVISPESWNSSIAAGKTVTFGFVGSPGNGAQSPTNYVLLSNSGGGESGGGNTGGGTNPGGDLPAATQAWPAK